MVLGSNALNDKNILAELCAPRFAATARSFLDSGRGIFGLQQIGLAMRKGPSLTCLPEPYGRVVPVVPPTGDRALTEGLLDLGAITAAHVAMTYPNPVNLKGLRQDALAFRAYQGLYRHYWDAVDLSDWDVLVIDPKGAAPPRPGARFEGVRTRPRRLECVAVGLAETRGVLQQSAGLRRRGATPPRNRGRQR